MTYTELVDTVRRLPATERRALLAVITTSLREDEQHAVLTEDIAPLVPPSPGHDPGLEPLDNNGSLLDQLRGIARPHGLPPTDAEVKTLIVDAVVEKYGS